MFKKIKRIGGEICVSAYNACFNHSMGVILMLHRIGDWDKNRLKCIENLKITTEKIEKVVCQYRKTHDFVTLDYVADCIEGRIKPKRPYICVTFDDGFKDNLSIGLPFFEKNRIPFAVFITVDFISRHPSFNYPFILERMIANNSQLFVDGQLLDCNTQNQKNEVFIRLKGLIHDIPYKGFENKYRALFKEYLRPEYEEDLMMNWDDVRELSNSEFCTIGSHTMTHCSLSNLSVDQLIYELGESKRQIEQHIGKEIEYTSYPFGWKSDVNEQVVKITREVGYRMGLISWGGPVRRKDKDMYQVKRQMLFEHE